MRARWHILLRDSVFVIPLAAACLTGAIAVARMNGVGKGGEASGFWWATAVFAALAAIRLALVL
jgi:hypothetical protein